MASTEPESSTTISSAKSAAARSCRAWTHAERRDYVSALDDINTLAKQREGVRDNVTYTVGTVAKNDAKDYSNVNEAARAFRDAKAEDQPYVIRTERLPNGRESASTPGQTTYTEKEGVREYGKYIGGNDEALKRAYADALRPEQERTARPVLALSTQRSPACQATAALGER